MAEPQIRIDPLDGSRVIIAPARSSRPQDFLGPRHDLIKSSGTCPFCEGQEGKTPPELAANRPSGGEENGPGWLVRVVPNKFPMLTRADFDDGGTNRGRDGRVGVTLDPSTGRGDPDLFWMGAATGSHEVVINSPEHRQSIAGLGPEQVKAAISMWRERVGANHEAAYCHLIVNEGREAGASLEHTHAQLMATDFVPPFVARERERFTAHYERTQGGCLLCDLLQEEVRLDQRVVAVDDDSVLIAPYASKFPYSLMVVPRQHQPKFAEDTVGAEMIHRAVKLLRDTLGDVPINMWARTAPSGAANFHWHFALTPRVSRLAGMELGAGVAVNTKLPEEVAEELKPA